MYWLSIYAIMYLIQPVGWSTLPLKGTSLRMSPRSIADWILHTILRQSAISCVNEWPWSLTIIIPVISYSRIWNITWFHSNALYDAVYADITFVFVFLFVCLFCLFVTIFESFSLRGRNNEGRMTLSVVLWLCISILFLLLLQFVHKYIIYWMINLGWCSLKVLAHGMHGMWHNHSLPSRLSRLGAGSSTPYIIMLKGDQYGSNTRWSYL